MKLFLTLKKNISFVLSSIIFCHLLFITNIFAMDAAKSAKSPEKEDAPITSIKRVRFASKNKIKIIDYAGEIERFDEEERRAKEAAIAKEEIPDFKKSYSKKKMDTEKAKKPVGLLKKFLNFARGRNKTSADKSVNN